MTRETHHTRCTQAAFLKCVSSTLCPLFLACSSCVSLPAVSVTSSARGARGTFLSVSVLGVWRGVLRVCLRVCLLVCSLSPHLIVAGGFARFYGCGQRQALVTRFLFQPLWLQVRTCTDRHGWFSDAFALVLWLKTGGLAGFVLGSNMIAVCSNTSVYVGVTIFALVLPVGVLVGFVVLASHWSRTFDRRCERHLRLCTQEASWLCPGVQHDSLLQQHNSVCRHLSCQRALSGISSLHVYAMSEVSRWLRIELDASSQC